ncbi:DUF2911 domain-containing protein [Winogradskyella thalassocola]|uniref:DUF2911 domain-containing protein n=1 Tax=Winogradskyella thalassocola TaxID=262004 RepID=A0A1G8IAA5_9FLAO|nr:DUF2911 domain-containing protein [Winogradskyella thalassocola]SDI15792.1 Protein of unknown function [Winogradskyella thalassocola]
MKTSKLLTSISLTFIMLISLNVNAQEFEKMDKSIMDRAYYPANAPKRTFEKTDEAKKLAEPQIRVTYSRPAKKGREVFGKLLKFGKAWRVGANESTEILFVNDVTFGGKDIKAGRYSIIIIPTENEWTLKLNTELDGWGNYGYDETKDIASVSVPVTKSKKEIENLSIALYKTSDNTVNLKIGWDTTIAEFPITLK